MAGLIPKQTIEDIRHHSDIVDVIGSHFTLSRAGGTFKALCPFHKEKTPSFTVNPERQVFHCFGCDTGGDIFKFVMQYENVDFITSVRLLADRAGITIEFEEGSDGEKGPSKDVLFRVLSDTARLYTRALHESPAAQPGRDYLKLRGLSEASIEDFGIGYVPNVEAGIFVWGSKKFTPEQLEAAGLIMKSTRSGGSPWYDRFRNRLMFPIHDELGRVVGFSGRAMSDDKKTAKYINSPETPVFKKSRILYGLHKARRAMADQREAIICEGQIDVIRCHAAGFHTAVAAQGTAFTEQHARVVRRYADSVVIVFDSDAAGCKATVKTARIFLRAGITVRVVRLPTGEDPDSFIVGKGAEAFRSLLDEAVSVLEFQVDLGADGNAPSAEAGLVRTTKEIMETISNTANAVYRSHLIKEAARLLDVPVQAITEELGQVAGKIKRRTPEKPEELEVDTHVAEADIPEELDLLAHLLAEPKLITTFDAYMAPRRVLHTQCGRLLSWIREASQLGHDITVVIRDKDPEPDELIQFCAKLQSGPEKLVGKELSREHAVQDLMLYIYRRDLEREKKQVDRLLRDSTVNNPDLRERRSLISSDLHLLKRWDTAIPIMELLKEEDLEPVADQAVSDS